jgi:hypothetical protein
MLLWKGNLKFLLEKFRIEKEKTMIKYTAEFYQGRKIGKGFITKVGYPVVATDSITGKRRYVFTGFHEYLKEYKTPCWKSSWVASHYKSGPNKHNREILEDFRIWAENMAKELNRTQPH